MSSSETSSVTTVQEGSGVRSTLFTGVIHKKVGPLLVRQINPRGEHGRDCSHVANQNRKGKRSDKKSHDRGISIPLPQAYYLSSPTFELTGTVKIIFLAATSDTC